MIEGRADLCNGCGKLIVSANPYYLCEDCLQKRQERNRRQRLWHEAPRQARFTIRLLQAATVMCALIALECLAWVLLPSVHKLMRYPLISIPIMAGFWLGFGCFIKSRRLKRAILNDQR
jgi:hypothetical protein